MFIICAVSITSHHQIYSSLMLLEVIINENNSENEKKTIKNIQL